MILATLLISLGAAIANPVGTDIGWRIVGGTEAETCQFPFIISLRTSTNAHTCGGCIINNKWIVTAAHCVNPSQPHSYSVVYGTNKLNDTNPSRANVKRIIVHPNWDPYAISNDIALLELEETLKFSRCVQRIPLEKVNVDEPRKCTIVGWGRTSTGAPLPNLLQFLKSKTVTNSECSRSWQGINPVFPSQVCTYTQEGQGACNGDSGGPLCVCKGHKCSLIGLVSWGSPCAVGKPDVYTRVSSFVEWINSNIN